MSLAGVRFELFVDNVERSVAFYADSRRVRAAGDRPVRRHDARLARQPAGAHKHPSVNGLLADRVRGPSHSRHVLVWNVVHRMGTEQDQILRHP